MPVGGSVKPRLVTTACALGPETASRYESVRGALDRFFSQVTVVVPANYNTAILGNLRGADIRQVPAGVSTTYEALRLAAEAPRALYAEYICRALNWIAHDPSAVRALTEREGDTPVFIERTASTSIAYADARQTGERLMSRLLKNRIDERRERRFNGDAPADLFSRALFADQQTFGYLSEGVELPDTVQDKPTVQIDSRYQGRFVALLFISAPEIERLTVDSLHPLHKEGLVTDPSEAAAQLRAFRDGVNDILNLGQVPSGAAA